MAMVYIVREDDGGWDDPPIRAVFSSEEAAHEFIAMFAGWDLSWEGYQLDEFVGYKPVTVWTVRLDAESGQLLSQSAKIVTPWGRQHTTEKGKIDVETFRVVAQGTSPVSIENATEMAEKVRQLWLARDMEFKSPGVRYDFSVTREVEAK